MGPAAIGRNEFIDEAVASITSLAIELEASKKELASLTSGLTRNVELSDANLFNVRSGTRITNTEVMNNRGEVPSILALSLSTSRRAALAQAILSEANVFKGRVEQLTADIPIDEFGEFDLIRQQEIAAADQRFALIREKLFEHGAWSQDAPIG